ncbi:ribosomal RNA-processing protein 14 [Salvia hispanica]|uniref:ribosomal RNA-processing protein 14 n=1 Tax=Salvia hispanica TaxID=49212 RepID=UPI0020098C5B|nr:ribosomal RNA-processing protein 14 [Salvia hispanica]
MKKKKQIPAGGLDSDLASTIHSQSEFFDHLIELIPSRFYISADDDSKPWYQGLSKAAKASLRLKTKENLKLARRNRFDPDAEPSSAVKHLQQREDGDSPSKEIDLGDSEKKSVTYEELREKLRRKIEALKGNRGEKRFDERKMRNEWNKRSRDGEGRENVGADNDDDGDDDGEEIIEYGKVKLGDEGEGRNSNKKRKLSKAQELERAKKKKEVMRENPSLAEKETWKAAVSRAMGVKVHDDAKLIKGSMKREKKRKEKNAEKWKERVGTVEKMKGERQKKRRDNIVGRINDKKARKIAKREKKLMRPGFEGRKEGFITKE